MNETQLDRMLEDLSGRYARSYREAVRRLYVAVAMQDRIEAAAARRQLTEAITETMGTAEVVGAMLTLQAAARFAALSGVQQFAADRRDLIAFADDNPQNILPRVTFRDALRDLVTRVPKFLVNAAERTAERIRQLYEQGRAMAFVRATEEGVTEAAQASIGRSFEAGLGEVDAGKRLADAAEQAAKDADRWSDGYARMAWRTNVNTGVSAGRFRQAQDPAVKQVIPALKFDTQGDVDVRHNHRAGDGVILRADNPAWARLAPPLGYNCRCQVIHVSIGELKAAGRWKDGQVVESSIPSGWGPDEGFRHGGRPDLAGIQP